eukprot:2741708-Pyramimonas_sp.AAC.1
MGAARSVGWVRRLPSMSGTGAQQLPWSGTPCEGQTTHRPSPKPLPARVNTSHYSPRFCIRSPSDT